jgi:hypothetical protein
MPTDLEVEAAAKALFETRSPHLGTWEDWTSHGNAGLFVQGIRKQARAALEAAERVKQEGK